MARLVPPSAPPAQPPPPPLARLQVINAELLAMGASDEYCRDYFKWGIGECKEKFGGICMCHITGTPPLPANVVCGVKFKTQLDYLMRRISFVEDERKNLKVKWADFQRVHVAAEGMLADNDEGQEKAKQQKAFLGTQIAHKLGELRGLEHELYLHLTADVRLVNTKKFHDRLTELLHEKMDIIAERITGRRVRARVTEPGPPSESEGA